MVSVLQMYHEFMTIETTSVVIFEAVYITSSKPSAVSLSELPIADRPVT